MDRDQQILDYLQDRLSPEERAAFETALTQDASLAGEVEVMRAVRSELASGPKHEGSEAGWERISAEIDALPKPANDNRPPWFQVLKYAAVATLAVAAWHMTIGPQLSAPPDGFTTASEGREAFSFQVKFADTATLSEIGALLAPIGGAITDGPTALGLVRISFSDVGAAEDARRSLAERTDLVEFVAE